MNIRIHGTEEEIEDILRRLPDISYQHEKMTVGAKISSLLGDGKFYQFVKWESE